jgi:ribosome-associated toxin RatA of RatAB toxin-antitoxin module
MTVRYITLRAPEQVAMTMTEGPRVFEKFSGAWNFEAIDAARTRVVFRYNFTTRPAWLRVVMEPIAAKVLQRDMDARLRGLKYSAERTEILSRVRS